MNPAALAVPLSRPVTAPPCARGGNLARVKSQNAGHFLFLVHQAPHEFGAQNANCHETAGCLPPVRGPGAATNRRAVIHAESRPFPFLEADHLFHEALLSVSENTDIRIRAGGKIIRA